MKKQQGGTLLGLVIGGLLGLGIALTVAVYVTKVPVPFMNKNASRPSESDAVEARKNKDWNPNAPLAGKNPAKAAPSVSGELSAPPEPDPSFSVSEPAPEMPKKPERTAKTPKPQPPAEAPTRVPEPDADPAPVAATKPVRPQPRLSGDPLGDLAKSRSESAPASSGSDPFNYFIQAGAYRTQEDADQQRARLVLLGMQAKVTEREQAGRTVYRVRVGPFAKKDDADKIKDRLDDNSIETALVRVQR
ncbi:cell division protein FtsN [Polaromonas sp. CG_9.5]|uniref:SPOR domain-containing protein n=1 Tax=Polaromonas sp. CG_9.5 TaxID=3071705 RepID=UPI002E009D38|nr:cell division protein FtsN [Polaromonas sp. CG_9.5]